MHFSNYNFAAVVVRNKLNTKIREENKIVRLKLINTKLLFITYNWLQEKRSVHASEYDM